MSRHPFRSLALLSMGLILAITGGVGTGAARAQATASPGAAAAALPGGRPLPPTIVAGLLKQIAANGRDSSLPPAIASTLGLTTGGEAWPNRQFAVRSEATNAIHAAAIGAGPDSDLILSNRGDAAITIFRLHRDGSLVGAVYYFPETQTTASVAPAEAAHDFDDERLFWLRTIDAIAADQ